MMKLLKINNQKGILLLGKLILLFIIIIVVGVLILVWVYNHQKKSQIISHSINQTLHSRSGLSPSQVENNINSIK